MLLCLGEPPVRFLCCCCSFWCVSSFVDVLHFLVVLLHSLPGYFTMSPALHSGFSGPWRPPPTLSSTPTPTTFDCLFFFIYRERYGFEWTFFTHRRFFILRSFPTFFAQPAFIKASLGAGSYSLKFAELHTDPRNTDPAHLFVWFTVIHNLLYILNLYLYMSILQKFLLVVKTLIKNIDQQPHY